MIFMYWTHPEIAEPQGAAAWRALYPEFRLFSDDDVYPLLPVDFVPIYKQIRLPAAKSDIARLFLLREYGGLYIDAHVGPTDPAKLVDTLDKLSAYNIIVFGYGWEMKSETDFNLMNGIIAARRNAPELTLLINRILRNVTTLKAKEDVTTEYVHYHLWGETGTYNLILELFDQVQPRPRIKDRLRNTAFVHFMKNNHDSGFSVSSHNNYQKTDSHWSNRERSERFFLEPEPVVEEA